MADGDLILPDKWRKVLSIIHQVLVGVFFLSAIYILVLLVMRSSAEGLKLKSLDLKVYTTVNGIFSWSFYTVIVSALIFALFTKWGFFKFRWIIAKWFLSGILFCITMFFVYPAVSGLVALRSGGFIIDGARDEYSRLGKTAMAWLIVEIILIAAMKVFSKLKPWGIRKKTLKIGHKTVLIITAAAVLIGLLFITVNFISLNKIRNMTINEPDLKVLENGKYIGQAEVAGFSYVVEVIMTDNRIDRIKVLKNSNNAYARWAEGVIHKIIREQSLQVDAITGATTTSKALMKAVSNSLQKE